MSACAKKHKNLNKFNLKKKASNSSKENQETKFMDLLTQLIPDLSNACTTKENNDGSDKNGNSRSKHGNDHNKHGSNFSKIEPCCLVCAGC